MMGPAKIYFQLMFMICIIIFLNTLNPVANFRTLDLNLLRLFDELMSERNLTRAAANLSMTQPAASNALRRLRDALSDPLVQRSGYGVEPTPFALGLWPAVRASLEQLRSAVAPEQFHPATAQRSFMLTMADSTATMLIPPLLRLIERAAPRVNLRVLPLTTRDPRQFLEANQIDAAIGFFPAVLAAIVQRDMEGGADTFETRRLYSGEYVCVMRRGHPLAKGTLTLETYCAARHLLVSFSGRPVGFVDEALASLKLSRRVVLTVNQFVTAGEVVARSDLLTVLPRHFLAATRFERSLAIRPLPLDLPPVHVDVLWHRRLAQRPGHAWLRQCIEEAARKAFSAQPDGLA
jgi:DNA-binding transcriptional LysR family regulator